MNLRRVLLVFSAVFVLLSSTQMSSQTADAQMRGGRRTNDTQMRGGRWQYLGEANVDGAADHDRISIGRSDGRFRSLQIKVERAPIDFQRVIVHYGNGENEEIEIRDKIRAGGTTRAIDLRGGDRTIESVEFWYARANYRSNRPRLRLYGR